MSITNDTSGAGNRGPLGADRRTIAGRDVGPIGLGCMGMTFAYAPDAHSDDPVDVIREALDLGMNLIDTADVYGPYSNELVVGEALQGRRDHAVLATKCGLELQGPTTWVENGRPDHIRTALDGSLSRLGTDAVDLFQLHRVDPHVPLADTWGAMAEAVTAGKARAIGLSEVTVEQLEEAAGVHPVASVQTELSLWSRDAIDEVVPWCEQHGAAFVAYSPLSRGALSGAYGEMHGFGADDYRSTLPRFTSDAIRRNDQLLATLRTVAKNHEATPAQVALAWLLKQSPVVIPIPGTRRLDRVHENGAAANLRLSPQDLAALTAAPLPEQPRY